MAMACLRDFTFPPLRPLLSVPRLRRRMALATRLEADRPYFRVPLRERARRVAGMSTPGRSVGTVREVARREQFPVRGKSRLASRVTREPPPHDALDRVTAPDKCRLFHQADAPRRWMGARIAPGREPVARHLAKANGTAGLRRAIDGVEDADVGLALARGGLGLPA
jgi:hypothetical protein